MGPTIPGTVTWASRACFHRDGIPLAHITIPCCQVNFSPLLPPSRRPFRPLAPWPCAPVSPPRVFTARHSRGRARFRPVGVAAGRCSSPFRTQRFPGALDSSLVELLVLSIDQLPGAALLVFCRASVAGLRGDNEGFGTDGERFKVPPRRRQRRQ